jgi:hypothetical protein
MSPTWRLQMNLNLPATITTIFWIILMLCSVLHAQTYTLTDLGTFYPRAIAGDWVVGREQNRPVRLDLHLGQRLFLPGGDRLGEARAVLPSGEAVGWAQMSVGDRTAAYWNAAGELSVLPVLPSEQGGTATALTAGPMITGAALFDAGGTFCQRLKRWGLTPTGETLDMGDVTNSTTGQHIDGQRRIWSLITQGVGTGRRLTVFNGDGTTINVASLSYPSFLAGVNPQGTALLSSAGDAFLATIQAGLLPLPRLPGASSCAGIGISPSGAAVGACVVTNQSRAVLWPSQTDVVDLNSVTNTQGAVLTEATGISEQGEIVGRTTEEHGFLLTPVPPAER